MIKIEKLNEVFAKLEFDDPGMEMTIDDEFAYYKPNFYFSSAYKAKLWDGKLHAYNKKNQTIYLNHIDHLIKICKKYNEKYEFNNFEYPLKINPIPEQEISNFLENDINIPYDPFEHQKNLLLGALMSKRMIALSPTASGKSYALYLYIKYLIDVYGIKQKILLLVPQISLVYQMENDFKNYETKENKKLDIHLILGGKEKNSNSQIYISTWQSIYKLEQNYFEQFKVLIVDEVHRATAQSLVKIAEKCINADYRLGVTGTLENSVVHSFVLEGIIGKIFKITNTFELIQKKILSELMIYNIILKYSKKDSHLFNSYSDEYNWIMDNVKRNLYIVKILTKNFDKNILILFTRIKHGKFLEEKIREEINGKKEIFYIDGETSVDQREEIRKKMENGKNHILIASTGCYSTGINIKNLHYIALTSGGKSKIKILQSIGRGLRVHKKKTMLKVIDFIDDMKIGKGKKNYMLKHFDKRLKIYKDEKFEFKNKKIFMK